MATQVEELVRTLADGTRPVVAIIGAGVSYAATHDPTSLWLGLLSNGIKYCAAANRKSQDWLDRQESGLNEAKQAGDIERILNVADLIVDELGGEGAEGFQSWLANSIGRLRLAPESGVLIDILRELSQRGMIVATTNYDSIVSNHLSLQPILWSDYRSELPVMNQMQEGILHLHGHWESPTSVIFSRRSYAHIVCDDTFQTLFRHLWLGYHWVYIGCGRGTDDPNFGRLLRWGAEKFGSASLPHFRLCLQSEAESFRDEFRWQPNLRLVEYGRKHEALPHFLEHLSESLPCRPFIRIKEQGQFFRIKTQRPEDIILPSRQEYLQGEVHRPKFVDALEQLLTRDGFAWLLGPASHGKTTAALLIATSPSRLNHPVYYLDLNDTPVAPVGTSVENVMQSLCRPCVLFIVDNVNRNEALARVLHDSWARHRRRSSVLFLGRSDPPSSVSFQPSRNLADLEDEAIHAYVELDDLEGLFRTLLSRLSQGRPPPIPPREVLSLWQETFASDLVAFCWALTARYRRLRLGDWDLPADAARQFVWAKYLEPLSTEERHNILVLATFARHELGLPPEVFQPQPFPLSLRMGIVLRKYNDGANDHFHLSEPGFGALLLGAVEPGVFNEANEISSVCAKSPSVAAAYSARLEASGERDKARTIATLFLQDSGAKWLLADHLPWAVDTVRRILRLHAANVPEVDDWLTRDPRHLIQAFHTQPFGALGHLIRYAADHLPGVLERITAIVAEPIIQDALAQRLAKVPPYDLMQFFESLKSEGLKSPVQGLWAKVATPENASLFISRALQGSLSQLDYFFRKAAAHRRKHFVALLWGELGRPESVDKIVRNGLHDSLHHFARLASQAVKMKRDALAASLWENFSRRHHWCQILTQLVSDAPQNSATFLATLKTARQLELLEWLWRMLRYRRTQIAFLRNALQGVLHTLTNFLDYAQREGHDSLVLALWQRLETLELKTLLADRALSGLLSELGRFLERALAQGRAEQVRGLIQEILSGHRRKVFDQKLGQSSADQMIGFFQRLDPNLIGEVVANFDAQSWLAIRERRHALPPYGLAALFKLFHEIGREDITIGEATAVIKLASFENWDHPTIGLELLGSVIRYAELATDEEVEGFLLRSVSPSWLDYRLVKGSAEAVANFLCIVAAKGVHCHAAVDRLCLLDLLAESLADLPSKGLDRGLKALALIGAGALVGLRPSGTGREVKGSQKIAREIVSELSQNHMWGVLKLQVWVGVWVLSGESSLEQFLKACKESFAQFWSRIEREKPVSVAVQHLSDLMVDWLRSAEQAPSSEVPSLYDS
ncbi:MAG: SIR2 family protein [Planctomycetes bacterium]|nr:SIR2 family protein [Planctomycetota bacterium]